jgi:hypothetical protein
MDKFKQVSIQIAEGFKVGKIEFIPETPSLVQKVRSNLTHLFSRKT